MRYLPHIFLFLSMITIISCKKKNVEYRIPEFPPTSVFDSVVDMTPAYAQYFKVNYLPDGTPLVDIVTTPVDGSSEADTFKLALIHRQKSPQIPEGYTKLAVPIHSVVCTDSRQISYFVGLDSLEIVKGVFESGEQHCGMVAKMMRDGKIEQIGTELTPDISAIKRLAPDVLLVSPRHYSDKTFHDCGVMQIPIFSAYEPHPIAQAEWIKLIAMLIGKEEFGSDYFGKTEQNYNDAKVSTLEVGHRPLVRMVVKDNGTLHELGKEHFQHLFISDAGGETPANNSSNRIVGYGKSMKFFEETATVAPDTVLKDLVSIIHPEVIPKDSVWERRYFIEISQ